MTKIQPWRVVFLLLVFYCLRLHAQYQNCKYKDANGNSYDLTPLAQLFATKPAASSPDPSGYVYYINPCQAVTGQPACNILSANIGICQVEQSTGNDFALGTWNGVTIGPNPKGKGITVSYPPYSNRGSNITFTCNKAAGVGTFNWISIPPPNNPPYLYTFEWKTEYACPIGGGGGGGDDNQSDGGLAGGWIFIIVLSGVTITYFCAGLAVNKFYFKKEGVELIPNSHFWISLPGLVKDGHLYIFNSVRRLFSRGSYEQV